MQTKATYGFGQQGVSFHRPGGKLDINIILVKLVVDLIYNHHTLTIEPIKLNLVTLSLQTKLTLVIQFFGFQRFNLSSDLVKIQFKTLF